MAKGLIEWASEQPVWVQDCLRRIALSVDHAVGEEDAACVLRRRPSWAFDVHHFAQSPS